VFGARRKPEDAGAMIRELVATLRAEKPQESPLSAACS
jgi:hypothetical protein